MVIVESSQSSCKLGIICRRERIFHLNNLNLYIFNFFFDMAMNIFLPIENVEFRSRNHKGESMHRRSIRVSRSSFDDTVMKTLIFQPMIIEIKNIFEVGRGVMSKEK